MKPLRPFLKLGKQALYRVSPSKGLMLVLQTKPVQSPQIPETSVNNDFRPVFTVLQNFFKENVSMKAASSI